MHRKQETALKRRLVPAQICNCLNGVQPPAGCHQAMTNPDLLVQSAKLLESHSDATHLLLTTCRNAYTAMLGFPQQLQKQAAMHNWQCQGFARALLTLMRATSASFWNWPSLTNSKLLLRLRSSLRMPLYPMPSSKKLQAATPAMSISVTVQ